MGSDFSVKWLRQEMRQGDRIELARSFLQGLIQDEKIALIAQKQQLEGLYPFSMQWMGIDLGSMTATIDEKTDKMLWLGDIADTEDGDHEDKAVYLLDGDKVDVACIKEAWYCIADALQSTMYFDERGSCAYMSSMVNMNLPLGMDLKFEPNVLASAAHVVDQKSATPRVKDFDLILTCLVQLVGNLGIVFVVKMGSSHGMSYIRDKKMHAVVVDLSMIEKDEVVDLLSADDFDKACTWLSNGVSVELKFDFHDQGWEVYPGYTYGNSY